MCGKTLYRMMGTCFLFAVSITEYNFSISVSMSIAFLFCRVPCWYVESSFLNCSQLSFLKEYQGLMGIWIGLTEILAMMGR